jgi:predicted ABC-type ATPase
MSFTNYYNIDLLKESINDKGLFKAIFFCSIPFAGKSYVLSNIKDGAYPVKVINTDNAVEFLAKQKRIDPTTAYDIVGPNKIKNMSKEIIFHSVNGMLPLMIDGTAVNTDNLLFRKQLLTDLGYDVAMVYIDVTKQTSLNRLRAKTRERLVPEDFIERTYDRIQTVLPFYKREFDDFVIVPNNTGDLTDKVITDAYKKLKGFMSSPVKNPKAEEILKIIRGERGSYLTPSYMSEADLKKKIKNWYHH